MRYYILNSDNTSITGPFEPDALKSMLAAQAIHPGSLASSEIAGEMLQIGNLRPCDWFPVSEIPDLGIHNLSPPPSSPQIFRRVASAVMMILAILLVAISFFTLWSAYSMRTMPLILTGTPHVGTWFEGLRALGLGILLFPLALKYWKPSITGGSSAA